MAQVLLAKDIYSPAVSSPLNPSSCYQIPSKPHRGRRVIHRANGTPTTPLSPTQQLLRQKASVAFHSEVLRQAVVSRPSTPSCADSSAAEALAYLYHQQEKNQRHHTRSYLGDVNLNLKGRRKPGKQHPLAAPRTPRRESCPAGGDLGMGIGMGAGEVHEILEESEPGEKEPLLSEEEVEEDVFRVDLGRAIEASPSSEPRADSNSEPKRRRPPVGVRIVRRVVLMLVLFSVFVVVPALRVRSLYKRHFGS